MSENRPGHSPILHSFPLAVGLFSSRHYYLRGLWVSCAFSLGRLRGSRRVCLAEAPGRFTWRSFLMGFAGWAIYLYLPSSAIRHRLRCAASSFTSPVPRSHCHVSSSQVPTASHPSPVAAAFICSLSLLQRLAPVSACHGFSSCNGCSLSLLLCLG